PHLNPTQKNINNLNDDIIHDNNDNLRLQYPFMSTKMHKHVDQVYRRNLTKRSSNTTGVLATFTLLIKANIGIGMLALAEATSNAGYILGPICIIIMGI
ncbi:hypothetical protein, partial [Salmonella sp. s51228]|uniref:hypothetical protein n=1 Tax=Salmonella sp. s51228 TaxID=3159652 RepID=UPI00397FFB1D